MKRLLLFLFLILLFAYQGNAQTSNDGVEMADVLRSSGKIYVVVAVIGVIFMGIVTYLFIIDRRLTKLENKNKIQSH